MDNRFTAIVVAAALLSGAVACANRQQSTNTTKTQAAETHLTFNADSAYGYVARQVDFGPRVPGTAAHDECRDWLSGKLAAFGADTVIEQNPSVTAFDGTELPITNIFASFNSGCKKRILLVAHYDTRPWADMEPDEQKRREPIPGANDGGSGVGVILEIARNIGLHKPEVGVDVLFVDAEDYGSSGGGLATNSTWCLGSQYWARNMVPYAPDALPQFGILLDMVGGRDATFCIEAYSGAYARTATAKVWAQAERLGHGDVFLNRPGGAAIDDHIVLTEAGIPTVDIIEIDNTQTGSFPPVWHTHSDNMANIDRNTLQAVGRTVLGVIYNEKP